MRERRSARYGPPPHFLHQTIAYAGSQGVPLASIAVPLSGVIALAAGLSILFGYRAKIGAWLIALFLVAVTPMLHNFWSPTPWRARCK
jgi:putative oxidoreductase